MRPPVDDGDASFALSPHCSHTDHTQTPGAVAFYANPHLVAPQARQEGFWRNASVGNRVRLAGAAARLRNWGRNRAAAATPPGAPVLLTIERHGERRVDRSRPVAVSCVFPGQLIPPSPPTHCRRVNNQRELDEHLRTCMPWMRHVKCAGSPLVAALSS